MAVNNGCNEVPTTIGTANQITATLSGTQYTLALASTVINPSQPLFSAYLSATQLNATGNGAAFTIVFDTVLFNQASSYNNATGIFTAPVTGKYLFCAQGMYNAVTTSGTSLLNLVTTSLTYTLNFSRTLTAVPFSQPGGFMVAMTAGDTARIQFTISGNAGNTVSVIGSADTAGVPTTYFSGYLLP